MDIKYCVFQLAENQKGMYFDCLLETVPHYNMSAGKYLETELQIPLLEKAISILIKKHSVLRTSINSEQDIPVQVIADEVTFNIDVVDIESLTDKEQKDFIKNASKQNANTVFDLSKAPLFKINLIRFHQEKYLLFICFHHIVADGWSVDVFLKEVLETYIKLCNGEVVSEDPHDIQFYEFVNSENEKLASGKYDKHKNYWKEKLTGIEPIDLLTDYPISEKESGIGRELYFDFTSEFSKQIKESSIEAGVTPYMYFLAAFKVLLQKYSGCYDITVSSPFSIRPTMKYEEVMGYFVNHIPIRDILSAEDTFQEIVNKVKRSVIDTHKHIKYPNNLIFRDLNLTNQALDNSILDVSFIMDIFYVDEASEALKKQLNISDFRQENQSALGKYMMDIVEYDDHYTCKMQFNSGLYKDETMALLVEHFKVMLAQVMENPELKLADINLITQSEKSQLVIDYNQTEKDYPYQKSIQQVFQEQVQKSPNQTCIIYNDNKLTYKEVNNRANQVAVQLREMGVGRNTLVALMIERSVDIFTGIMGILKAGGAYVPVDPDFPEERISYMMDECETKFMLSHKSLKDKIKPGTQIIWLDDEQTYTGNVADPESLNQPEDMAYMIYTSGSTGKPKGVLIPHRAVNNFSMGITDGIELSGKTLLSYATFSFDMFVLESLLAMSKGVTVVIANEEEQKDPYAMDRCILKNKIDVLESTASRFKLLVETDAKFEGLSKITDILVGGEELPYRVFNKLKEKTNARIFNMYGPTETTCWSSFQELTNRTTISIGKPISNTQIYILDDDLNVQPTGVLGELCIGGAGVALGYFKREELTADRFVNNPFRPGEKIYRTGDLARWLPDGELEIKGRKDFQIKIRGYRIELGEIEKLMMSYKGIKEAVVIAREDQGGNKYLCAYYVQEESTEKTGSTELRDYLSGLLPQYMVPSYFVYLDKLPLSTSNKIDRKALPEPEAFNRDSKTEFLPPQSELEKTIANVWKEVLKLDKVGINDNFFELGGHSLSLIQVSNKLKKLFNRDIPIIALFQYPTISALVKLIESQLSGKKEKKQISWEKKRPNENTDVAIIGMSGRFPNAASINEFWDNIINGKDCMTRFTKQELIEAGLKSEAVNHPDYIPVRGILKDLECFDPEVFDYSPREADMMDPQLRVLYMVAMEAMEDAGYNHEEFPGLISCFAGNSDNFDWLSRFLIADENIGDLYLALTLNASTFLSTRLSYKLNLRGPSYTAMTACSTSLVTLHAACQSIIRGECDMALAGGITVELPYKRGYLYADGMMMAKDGYCRPFDEKASGTVFSDGAGMVLLKSLEQAQKDGDHIYAVVKGSAINNDGNNKVAFTAPSIEGQTGAVIAAYQNAGINPETVSYIETHGTATNMGDPIEVEALTAAFNTDKKQFCRIGSVKGNIGHTDSAAGITSIIKAALSLKNKVIPPTRNFEEPNSKINFEETPFAVTDRLTTWEESQFPRRAGVSSFGVGGTNAHIVLEEPPATELNTEQDEHNLFVLSAHTKNSLVEYAGKLEDIIRNNPENNLSDIAYTLQTGRKSFKRKHSFIAESANDLIQQLKLFSKVDFEPSITGTESRPIIFVFPESDKNSKYFTCDIYNKYPTYQSFVNEALELLPSERKGAVLNAFFNANDQEKPDVEILQLTTFIQKYALAKLLIKWGLNPRAMMGLTQDELVVACLANTLKLEDALNLVTSNKDNIAEKLSSVTFSTPEIPYISSITGTWINSEQATNPDYYKTLFLEQANLTEGFNELLKEETGIFIEIGSSGIIKNQIFDLEDVKERIFIELFDHKSLTVKDLLILLGELWSKGTKINWENVHEGKHRRRVSLPTYAFEKHKFSIETVDLHELVSNGGKNNIVSPFAKSAYTRSELGADFVKAEGETEEKTVQAFENALGIMPIGVNEDFFALGGDSLKAVGLSAELEKVLNVKVDLSEIFKKPTPGQLSEYIKEIAGSVVHAPIKQVDKAAHYPLSSAQLRMYAMYQLDEGSTAYNLPSATIIQGKANIEQFENAFKKIVQRHESLRTSFDIIDGEPVQIINDSVDFNINYKEAEKGNYDIDSLIAKFIRPYDLSKAPLFRVEVIKLDEEKYLLLFDAHHIISDGTSMEIINMECMQLLSGELPELELQYKDFSAWQNNLLQSDDLKLQKEYWLNRFKGEIPLLNMPTDFPRPAVKVYDGDRHRLWFNEEQTEALKKMASENGATLYMTMLSMYNVLLHLYTGQEDIIVGSPSQGRRHKDLEPLVGMFVNTLAMRNFPSSEKSFIEFLGEVKQNALDAFENQDYQFDDLIENLDLNRDLSRNPLFDTEFDLQNMQFAENELEGLSIEDYEIKDETSQFDIALECQEIEGKIRCTFEYCTKLFCTETIERIGSQFVKLTEQVLAQPDLKLSEVNITTEQEREQLIYAFNKTETDYPKDKSIHQIFEEQVRVNPDHIALIFEGIKVTNAELNEKANQLAHLLQEKGVGKGIIVGLMVSRSVEMITGILAILKAGGCYVPLDPGFPSDRIDYMIEDSETKLILTQKPLSSRINKKVELLCIEDEALYSSQPSQNPENQNQPEDLAYIIYTSGSTGKPKGVMISHRAVNNFNKGINDIIPFKGKRILSVTTFSFDIFVLESLLPLQYNATIVLANEEEQRDPVAMNKVIGEARVNMIQTTPSRMKVILESDDAMSNLNLLKDIMVGGEAFPPALLPLILQKTNSRVFNMYGPTETTVWSSVQELTHSTIITVGKPIANTQIYIVNQSHQLQPIGVFGELCIAGDGLTNGYFKRDELTNERLVENPFIHGTKMYKTGDLARWLSNGEIEVTGRMDFQVKIRGYRIELGEIEDAIQKHAAVKEAVVTARKDKNDNNYLCGYYVKHSDSNIVADELRSHLSEILPSYMIPSYFIEMDELPLTPNAKVDRKALPEPKGTKSLSVSATKVAPRTSLEQTIADIWKEVLNIEEVGVKDNFFDIGGHSMALIQVNNKLRKLANKNIPVVVMFQYPTIESLVNYLEDDEIKISRASKKVKKKPKLTGDIAIIGIAGRFPGAKNIDEFWDIIRDGKETIRFFEDEELKNAGVSEELLSNPNYVKAKGYLEGTEYFDSAFFNYSPMEADLMDPQFRMMHEETWSVLENAGYNPEKYEGKIGLFAGSSANTLWLTRLLMGGADMMAAYEADTLNEKDFLSTRISYKLDLKGPSCSIQTACSTSLVAVHQACHSILKGESDMAIAGGVSLSLPRIDGFMYQDGMIFSSDGHCRPFDENANGTVFGNGIGLVLLKSLDEALEDGDTIHAVIKGSAINNDGIRKIGFTAPSIEGQSEAILDCYEMAGIEPESISYIEAHGTGTNLGDPIELEALKTAFASDKKKYCAVGSVKANVGHLDIAAGITGLIKTTLSLKHKQLPPSINYDNPNPKIDFENSPFYVNTELREWKNGTYPQRAGVSSFGIGGTNAHVVVEIAPKAEESTEGKAYKLFVLSGNTKKSLRGNVSKLKNFLEVNKNINLADATYTLQVGRKAFKHRVAFAVKDVGEAIHVLGNELTSKTVSDDRKQTVFMFTGQGSQYKGLASGLYNKEPFFKQKVDECLNALSKDLSQKIKGAILNDNEVEVDVNHTEIAQLVIFVIEYSLAKLLMQWGIKPSAMIGHSIGEYVAACVSGVFSLNDALTIVSARGRLMMEQPTGSMLAIPSPVEEIQPLLPATISLAAVNSSSQCVVSGPDEVIEKLKQLLAKQSIVSTILHTSHAFHSEMMKGALEPFEKELSYIKFNEPQIPYISNETGTWITVEQAIDPKYWADHILNTVNFSQGLSELLKEENAVFVEVGAGKTLTTFAKQHNDKKNNQSFINTLRHPKEDIEDMKYFYGKIGELWCSGIDIKWQSYHDNEKRFRIPLPTYSFEKQAFTSDVNLSALMNGGFAGGMQQAFSAPVFQRDEEEIEDFCEAETDTEKAVVNVFAEILGLNKISLNEDFFELGGDSLKGIRLVNNLQKSMNVKVDINELFSNSTPKALAAYLDKAQKNPYASIEPVSEQPFYPTSAAQKRMFALNRFDESGVAYNMISATIIEGEVDIERFKKAYQTVIDKQASLRTSFGMINGEPIQRIAPIGTVRGIVKHRVENITSDGEINDIAKKFLMPFNLEIAPLVRTELVEIAPNRHVLLFDMHHIIGDGTSIEIMIGELVQAYVGETSNLNLQYKDFAVWQHDFFKSAEIEKQKQYWIDRFSDELPKITLPTDFKRPNIFNFKGETIFFDINEGLTNRIKKVSEENGATLFMTLLSAFNILLSKYSNQKDIIIGVSTSGRNHSDLHQMIGMFINALAMRNLPEGNKTFKGFLQEVKQNTLEAFANQDYQFDDLVDQLDIPRDRSRNPLFDVNFVLQNMDEAELDIENLKFKSFELDNPTSKFDLSLECREENNAIRAGFEYYTAIFKKETVEQLCEHFVKILEIITEQPNVQIKDIDIVSEIEHLKVVHKFNNTSVDYPIERTVYQFFEEQVKLHPEAIALDQEGKTMSYSVLNEEANKVAHFLIAQGVQANEAIAILLDHSMELIVSILGILKSGAAYVPLNPSLPADRMVSILRESQCATMLFGKKHQPNVDYLMDNSPFLNLAVCIDGNVSEAQKTIGFFDKTDLTPLKTGNPDFPNSSNDLAYILYTSGSTGKPKGVMIEHQSLTNYIWWASKVYLQGDKLNFPLFTSISFDLTVTSIFTPLTTGNSIVIYNGDVDENLKKILSENKVGVVKLTPSHLQILNELKSGESLIKRFILGGEELLVKTASDTHRVFGENIEIFNEYGPTEATVGCMIYKYDPKKDKTGTVSIGRPSDNNRIYILDDYLKPVPLKVPGEMYIAGDGLARGYNQRPDLTKERFIKDPFNRGGKMYKTGDLAKWLPDGNIEFMGRIDNQVKLRGYRIEIGEIESVLGKVPQIDNAIVLLREDHPNEKYLCAYYTGKQELNAEDIKSHLQSYLPLYMHPSFFIKIDEIPLTTNGKLNNKALPKPNMDITMGYEAPRNEIEKQMVGVWQEVLGLEKVGITNNFFEIGGDSIKAIQLASRMLKALQNEIDTGVKIQAEQDLIEGEVPLTPVQSWFFDNNFTDQHYFNQSISIFSKDEIQEESLREVLDVIIAHHDALRMKYQIRDGNVLQINRGLNVELYELVTFMLGSTVNLQEEIGKQTEIIQSGINLENGPLFKVALFYSSEGSHIVFVAHHLVVDGISWRILLEDLSLAFAQLNAGQQIELPEKTTSFKVWAERLTEKYSQIENPLTADKNYWTEIAKADTSLLPKDKEISEKQLKDNAQVVIELSKEDSEFLISKANSLFNTEINDLLLSALSNSISNFTNREQVLIQLEGHGREDILENVDISRTIGWFTNMYPVLLNAGESENVVDRILKTKESLRRVPHKGIAYGLLKYLQDKEFHLNPEILFNYLGQVDGQDGEGGFSVADISTGNNVSPNAEFLYALEINGLLAEGKLSFSFTYNSKEYNKETIQKIADNFKQSLLQIVEFGKQNPDFKLSSTELLYDSYKVEDQVISNMGDKGMALRLNDIFTYPTIKELSNYLQTFIIADDNLITSLSDAENKLMELLGTEVKLKLYKVEGEEILVLFVGNILIDEIAIKELIRKHVDSALYPNYVTPISKFIDLDELTFEELSDILELNQNVSVDELIGNLDKKFELFVSQITGQSVEKQYELTAMQRAHLTVSQRLCGNITEFENMPDYNVFQKAILEVIKNQELMRTIMVQGDKNPEWKVFESPEILEVPYVDLSALSIIERNKVVDELLNAHFAKSFNEGDLLYSIAYLKLDTKHSIVILPFDHSIFDGQSREVLRRNIITTYQSIEKNEIVAIDNSQPYSDYTQQIKKGPVNINEQEIIDAYRLYEYNQYKAQVEDKFISKESGNLVSLDYEIARKNENSDEKIWELAFQICSQFFKNYLEVEKIPVKIVYYGRHYEGNSYFGSIGEFLDLLPVIVDTNDTTFASQSHHVHQIIDMATNHNINFLSLYLNETLNTKYPEIVKLISSEKLDPFDPMIMFNYQGKFNEKEFKIGRRVSHESESGQRKQESRIASFEFNASYTSDKIMFHLATTIAKSVQELEDTLVKSIKQIKTFHNED